MPTCSLHRLAVFVLLLGLLPLGAACGSGGQKRPQVVGIWPSAADPVVGPLPYVRVDFDEPVRLLNPRAYSVSVDAVGFGTVVRTYPDDTDSIYIYPSGRDAFPEDGFIGLTIRQGLVVNHDLHYSLEITGLSAMSGSEATLPVGVPGAVSLVDCSDGSTVETLGAPGAHDPVAVLSTTRGTTRRIWVQFDGDGGSGASLAWFSPGDGAMTTVALTSAGELTTPHGTLAVGPRGRVLYAAFRDEGTGAISVHTVDTGTGLETGVVVLESQAADPTAVPRSLALQRSPTPMTVHVVTEDAAGAFVARVNRATFTEVDLDPSTPGIQGIALPADGGPCVVTDARTWVAPATGADLDLAPASGLATTLPGVATGVTTSLTVAPDENLILHGLTGFAGIEMLQSRTINTEFTNPTPVEVSDDVAGASTGATAVIGMGWLQGSDTILVVLDTGAGTVLTEWAYSGAGMFEQIDLDLVTAGVQGILLAADVRVVGSNHGPFAD